MIPIAAKKAPGALRIASWNVNSLPVRAAQMIPWFFNNEIDLLAVQETKVNDPQFPEHIFTEQGLHVVFSGQKSYNGVAFITRQPLSEVMIEPASVKERRIIAATFHSIRIINVYVPNGSEVASEKYLYKLHWLEELTGFVREQCQIFPKLIVLGDFNIAPSPLDVHDPTAWEGAVLVSPLERLALERLQALGLQDSFRHHYPAHQAYSWWDYRAASFRRNRGLRIDLILMSTALIAQCSAAGIDTAPREHERPSDHAPVWIEVLQQ